MALVDAAGDRPPIRPADPRSKESDIERAQPESGTLRFDGRTAIVTGAGGNPSLGRAHALLLAARGANVVVNDIGRDPETPGYSGSASAAAVAEEIRALGGNAVVDVHSVATEEGACAIVQTALDAFGGVDILINNAAISIAAPFDEMSSRDFRRHIDTNLMGPVWTCRAAWTHMRSQGYGRIVNVTSGAFAGCTWLVAYGASKGGLLSLTRALAAEGAALGIMVNAVNPGAFTRMVAAQQASTSPMYRYAKENLPPELVSPVVALLAHEKCPATGECIEAVGGNVRRIYLAQTTGFTDRNLTPEAVAARWNEVMAGSAQTRIAHGGFDPTQWDIKPYRGADGPRARAENTSEVKK
jgi:NAD(P)-dependent dehydrogenase (short-subunit alcohol dehydrogenase family)